MHKLSWVGLLLAALDISCARRIEVSSPSVSAPSATRTAENPLTANWIASEPRSDGTARKTYFNLTQNGERITGTIRTTQFYYAVNDSSVRPDSFLITGAMQDGRSIRRQPYIGKLRGDTLHVWQVRPQNQLGAELFAVRGRAGEGAMPARIEPPAPHLVRDNGLARTPPMGWNSWNKFAGRIDDATVRAIADAMASNGMREAGYVYVNIDDTWEGERDAKGNITTNKKFPDMKALADYVHGKGLKLGIYSSPGPNTCAGYEGSYGHEDQDARTYAAWGIDYLKYDWCGARTLYTDEEMPRIYQKMGDALLATGRPIVYSLCQYGRFDVWRWGADVGGNLWRTTGDIRDTWDSMSRIGFGQDTLGPFAKPGHWNDPDMLEIGNGGMTTDEYKTHMSLWSMLAAPLLAGNDLRSMTPEILALLTNRDVIAIDQDPDGKQARRTWKNADGTLEGWMRPLSGGAHAVALFNRVAQSASLQITWSDLGISTPVKAVRDLWSHGNLSDANGWSGSILSHGVVLLRLDH